MLRDYVLIIAEKPKAAQKIAYALAGAKAKKYSYKGIPYWVFRQNGQVHIVAPSAGHLFTLSTDLKGYPVVNYRWVPRWVENRKSLFSKRFLELMEFLCKGAIAFINACDYDIEGSVIGFLVIMSFGNLRNAYRMKFSSLTITEIRNAFRNLSPLDWNMIEAGLCRHELDWLWGINLSRALSHIVSKALGKRLILSAGRVQSPTLTEAVRIITQRRLHIPEPLYYPKIFLELNGRMLTPEFTGKPFPNKAVLQSILMKIKYEPYAFVKSVDVHIKSLAPPHPFNLSDLQTEAYRLLRIGPARTQKVAEDLYLDALISYPRTNSQKLPPTLDNNSIMKSLSKMPKYTDLVRILMNEVRGVLKPNNGPKEDPAHPAIYPTGVLPKQLPPLHEKLYDIITRRYLATFSLPARIREIKVVLDIHGLNFVLKSVHIVNRGWLKYYPFIDLGPTVPEIAKIRKGMKLYVTKAQILTRYTSPPPPLTKLSLLKWMEHVGIGTESTRAEIIEILFKRQYLHSKGKRVEVSDLGIAVAYLLADLFPHIVDIGLTRKFEEYMELIREGRLKREVVVKEAKMLIKKLIEEIKREERRAIEVLAKYLSTDTVKNPCPICGRERQGKYFCIFHEKALTRIRDNFLKWNSTGYDWQEYLEKIRSLKITGLWVREVAEFLLKNRLD